MLKKIFNNFINKLIFSIVFLFSITYVVLPFFNKNDTIQQKHTSKTAHTHTDYKKTNLNTQQMDTVYSKSMFDFDLLFCANRNKNTLIEQESDVALFATHFNIGLNIDYLEALTIGWDVYEGYQKVDQWDNPNAPMTDYGDFYKVQLMRNNERKQIIDQAIEDGKILCPQLSVFATNNFSDMSGLSGYRLPLNGVFSQAFDIYDGSANYSVSNVLMTYASSSNDTLRSYINSLPVLKWKKYYDLYKENGYFQTHNLIPQDATIKWGSPVVPRVNHLYNDILYVFSDVSSSTQVRINYKISFKQTYNGPIGQGFVVSTFDNIAQTFSSDGWDVYKDESFDNAILGQWVNNQFKSGYAIIQVTNLGIFGGNLRIWDYSCNVTTFGLSWIDDEFDNFSNFVCNFGQPIEWQKNSWTDSSFFGSLKTGFNSLDFEIEPSIPFDIFNISVNNPNNFNINDDWIFHGKSDISISNSQEWTQFKTSLLMQLPETIKKWINDGITDPISNKRYVFGVDNFIEMNQSYKNTIFWDHTIDLLDLDNKTISYNNTTGNLIIDVPCKSFTDRAHSNFIIKLDIFAIEPFFVNDENYQTLYSIYDNDINMDNLYHYINFYRLNSSQTSSETPLSTNLHNFQELQSACRNSVVINNDKEIRCYEITGKICKIFSRFASKDGVVVSDNNEDSSFSLLLGNPSRHIWINKITDKKNNILNFDSITFNENNEVIYYYFTITYTLEEELPESNIIVPTIMYHYKNRDTTRAPNGLSFPQPTAQADINNPYSYYGYGKVTANDISKYSNENFIFNFYLLIDGRESRDLYISINGDDTTSTTNKSSMSLIIYVLIGIASATVLGCLLLIIFKKRGKNALKIRENEEDNGGGKWEE